MLHGVVCTLDFFGFLKDFSVESFVVNIRYLLFNLLFLLLCNQSLIFFLLLHTIIQYLLLPLFHPALLG
jgi:hypothetical protein